MFVWIMILSFWIALCLLILHDATKEDSAGSAILLAAKKINTLGLRIRLKARRSRRAIKHRNPDRGSSKFSLKVAEPSVSAVSSPSEATPQEGRSVEKQAPARPKKRKWWSKDSRVAITGPELEAAISKAVKTAPCCEDFVGVIVGRKTPKSHLDPNWEIQGAKFGKADRKLAEETLANIVQRMQQELLLVED